MSMFWIWAVLVACTTPEGPQRIDPCGHQISSVSADEVRGEVGFSATELVQGLNTDAFVLRHTDTSSELQATVELVVDEQESVEFWGSSTTFDDTCDGPPRLLFHITGSLHTAEETYALYGTLFAADTDLSSILWNVEGPSIDAPLSELTDYVLDPSETFGLTLTGPVGEDWPVLGVNVRTDSSSSVIEYWELLQEHSAPE